MVIRQTQRTGFRKSLIRISLLLHVRQWLAAVALVLMAYTTTASAYGVLPDIEYLPRYDNADKTVSTFSYPMAAFAASVADDVYGNQSKLTFRGSALVTNGFQDITLKSYTTIVGATAGAQSLDAAVAWKTVRIYGKTRRVIVVAFRGTQEGVDWDANLDATDDTYNPAAPGIKVHKGFMDAERAFESASMESQYKIDGQTLKQRVEAASSSDDIFIITGHSLGAAVATLYASRLLDRGVNRDNLLEYNFGSPSVGNADYVYTFFNNANPGKKLNLHRIRNAYDLVPFAAYLALLKNRSALDLSKWHFQHVGTMRVFQVGEDITATYQEMSVKDSILILAGTLPEYLGAAKGSTLYGQHSMTAYIANVVAGAIGKPSLPGAIPAVTVSPQPSETPFADMVDVTLTTDPGVTLYYTLDGTSPKVNDYPAGSGLNNASPIYTGAIHLAYNGIGSTQENTLRVMAVSADGATANTHSLVYRLAPKTLDMATQSYLQIIVADAAATLFDGTQNSFTAKPGDTLTLHARNTQTYPSFTALTGPVWVVLRQTSGGACPAVAGMNYAAGYCTVIGTVTGNGGIQFALPQFTGTSGRFAIAAISERNADGSAKTLVPQWSAVRVVEADAVTIGTGGTGTEPAILKIAAGDHHTCVITSAEGVKCWGDNTLGQLGDNSTSQRLTPVNVTGLASGMAAIAAGYGDTCALTTAGGVKCWGVNVLTPANVTGLASGMTAVAAGGGNPMCALTTAGGVKCLGTNTLIDVAGLASGVAAIAVGGNHICALTTAGGMKCLGQNYAGLLGNNSSTDSGIPVDVTGLTSGVAAIATGYHHNCALTTVGGVKCWGDNFYGQLGVSYASMSASSVPVDVPGLTSGVAAISAGYDFTCALNTAGGVKCWGLNTSGQLGDNSTTNRLMPVGVTGLSSGVAAISAGVYHACALTTTGGVKCWGGNGYGQLGDNSTTQRLMPVDVTGFAGGATLDYGLIGYWNFDQGNANLTAGSANNGLPTSAVTFGPGKSGMAAIFSGVNSPGHIRIPNSTALQFANEATYSMWVRVDAFKAMDGWGRTTTAYGGGAILAKSHDVSGGALLFNVSATGDASTGFATYQSWPTVGADPAVRWIPKKSLGQWTLVTMTLSAQTGKKIYIDGTLYHSSTGPVSFASMNTQDIFIGKYSDSWYPFFGAIDEVRIYNRVLSYAEIQSLAGSVSTPAVVPTVTYNSETLPDGSYQVGTATKTWSFTNSATAITGLKAVPVTGKTDTGLGITATEIVVGDVAANASFTVSLPIVPDHAGAAIKSSYWKLIDSTGADVKISNSKTGQFWLKLRTNLAPVFSSLQLDSVSAKAGQTVSLPILTRDGDGDALTFTASSGSASNGLWSGSFATPGVQPVTLTVSDGVESASKIISVVVRDAVGTARSFSDVAPDSTANACDPVNNPSGAGLARDYADIEYLFLRGVVIGVANGAGRKFEPCRYATQAEALKMLMEAVRAGGGLVFDEPPRPLKNLEVEDAAAGIFVNASWAAPYVLKAEALGIIPAAETFAPQAPASRAWLARAVTRLQALIVPVDAFAGAATTYQFPDQASFANAQDYNDALATAFFGYMGQLASAFNPADAMIRADVARVASRILRTPRADDVALGGTTITTVAGRSLPALIQGGNLQVTGLVNLVSDGLLLAGDTVKEDWISTPASHVKATVIKVGSGVVANGANVLANTLASAPVTVDTATPPAPGTEIRNLLVLIEDVDSGVRSVIRKDYAVLFPDRDGDGVRDDLDVWPDNPLFSADANGNGIPDNVDAAFNIAARHGGDAVNLNGTQSTIIAALLAGKFQELAAAFGSGVSFGGVVQQPGGSLLLDFAAGWNLSGNGSDTPLNVASTFSDATKVTTVWKWLPATSQWAFYTPSLAGQQLTDYIAAKGYAALDAINAGEGFWINAKTAFTATVSSGNAVTAIQFGPALPKGWSLISLGAAPQTPTAFNTALGYDITTLWAWDNPLSKWYFYAPSLERSGGLQSYIQSKSYLDFIQQGKTLGWGTGFWVNKP